MDFSWTEEQVKLKDAVVAMARRDLGANLPERDRSGEFDHAGWKKCAVFGLQGLPIPSELGGQGRDVLTTILALEGLGYGCHDNGLIFAIHAQLWSCTLPILTFGTEAQKAHYLPRLCAGELLGGNAMTEEGTGSDAYALETTAERRGDRYLLNGRKVFVTNGPAADVLVVFATLDASKGAHGITAFLVEKGDPGFSAGAATPKMGLRTVPMGPVILENCEIPLDRLLGPEGGGVSVFTHAMEWERAFILASAVGAMERQLETCVQRCRKRRQFGRPIGQFQMVSSKLVDMKLRLETSRGLLYKVGWLKDQGRSALMEAATAKLHISECWVQSCLDAMQIHGGHGYLSEMELERDLRDALGSRFYSGTSEIHRLIIARFLGV